MTHLELTFFDNCSVVDDVDVIRFVENMKGMRDKYTSGFGKWTAENALFQKVFANICINSRQGVIKQNDIRLSIRCPSERDPRFLPTCAVVSHLSFKVLRGHEPLRLIPFSPISVNSPFGRIVKSCSNAQAWRTARNFSSSYFRPKRMFSRTVAFLIQGI